MNTPEARRKRVRRDIVAAAAYAMNEGGPRGLGVSVDVLRGVINVVGKPLETEEIHAAIEYLVGKGFLVEVPQVISPNIKAWKLTAQGMDWAEQEGLA